MTLMAMEPPVARAPVSQWWIVMARPQYEERLAESLNAAGAHAVAPREIVRRTYEDRRGCRQTKEWTRPIFGQYVFFEGDRDLAFDFDATIRVLQTTPQDCRKIDNIVLAYASGPLRRATGIFTPRVGLRVKIVSGSYMGVEGEITRFGDTRVFLQLDNKGIAEFYTDRENIEPLWGD